MARQGHFWVILKAEMAHFYITQKKVLVRKVILSKNVSPAGIRRKSALKFQI
jgi:hypothetical protein